MIRLDLTVNMENKGKKSVMVLLPIIWLTFLIRNVDTMTHRKQLLWTEKDLKEGIVYIKGIPGEPGDWVNKTVRYYSISFFVDTYSQNVSSRLGLGFDWQRRTIFSSDGGFKQIYGIILADTSKLPYVYNTTMHVVYTGISTQVNGLAVDWLSGSIYWTDALYDWIMVAKSTDLNVYTHLFVRDLDKPMGIAVYPKRGLLYWTDIGDVPKIERSTLGGENRMLFVGQNVGRPMGLTIDVYDDRVYWVDDLRSTIESVDLDGNFRTTIQLKSFGIMHARLFGIAIYKDYIFVSDQQALSIRSFNKTEGYYISQVSAGIFEGFDGIPYDIIMYDGSLQENLTNSCPRLGCSDICISEGGSNARCMCRDGYILSPVDGKTCIDDGSIKKPQYLYSVGTSLCGTYVQVADLLDDSFIVDCFWNSVGHQMTSMDFHNYAEFLFFSDETDRVIHRIRLDVPPESTQITVVANNVGTIRGIAVDWIGDNLYHMNDEEGTIIVSQLDGKHPRELISGIQNGKSLGVNPHNGTLYWVTTDTIYIANMDGSGILPLIHIEDGKFDGMVVDIRRNTLYWVDDSLPGIRSCRLDGSFPEIVLVAENATNEFHDVTVYKDYITWTDGDVSLYFAVRSFDDPKEIKVLRGIKHINTSLERSHDVITYDEYLQPLLPPSVNNPCASDSVSKALSCEQLCLLKSNYQRSCSCSYGLTLSRDKRSCESEWLKDNFLLYIDPYLKTIYQQSLEKLTQPPEVHQSPQDTLTGAAPQAPRGGKTTEDLWGAPVAIPLNQASSPPLSAFDMLAETFYWLDEGDKMNFIMGMTFTEKRPYIVKSLSKSLNIGSLDTIPQKNQIIFTDNRVNGAIYLLNAQSGVLKVMNASGTCQPQGLAVDKYTGDVYWIDKVGEERTIYKCTTSDGGCDKSPAQGRTKLLSSSSSYQNIKGLTVEITERKLIFYTDNSVYSLNSDGSTSLLAQLNVDKPLNLTAVAVVGSSIFYVEWSSRSVYKAEEDSRGVFRITESAFNRLTDLKPYRRRDLAVPGSSGALTGGAVAGIVIGSLLFLLLLLLLLLLLILLARRRRRLPRPYKAEAHDNPTYMTRAQVASMLATGGHSIDAAALAAVYAADVKKIKKPVDDDIGKVDIIGWPKKNNLEFPVISVTDDFMKKKPIDEKPIVIPGVLPQNSQVKNPTKIGGAIPSGLPGPVVCSSVPVKGEAGKNWEIFSESDAQTKAAESIAHDQLHSQNGSLHNCDCAAILAVSSNLGNAGENESEVCDCMKHGDLDHDERVSLTESEASGSISSWASEGQGASGGQGAGASGGQGAGASGGQAGPGCDNEGFDTRSFESFA